MIRINKFERHYTFDLEGALEEKKFCEGTAISLNALAKSPMPTLIYCSKLKSFDGTWLRSLVQLSRQLKQYHCRVVLLQLPEGLSKDLAKQGLDEALPSAATVAQAHEFLGITAASKKAFDVNLVNPFILATAEVLKIQVDLEVSAGKMFCRQENQGPKGDVSGVIGVVSSGFNGSIIISFPEPTFLQIMSRMLGENVTEMTKEIADGAGEITNIIFGTAKKDLNQKGHDVKMALPTVVTGKNHTFSNISPGPSVVVPFTSAAGEFYIEVVIDTAADSLRVRKAA